MTTEIAYCTIKTVRTEEVKMRFRHKYFGTPTIYFILFLLAAIAFTLAGYFVRGSFELLCTELPSLFRSKNFITDPDGYERQERAITLITAIIALLLVSYASLLLDNKRMEYISKCTEGKYTLFGGLKIYFSAFFTSDVITAILPPAILAIPVYFVPESWLEYGLRFPMMTSLEICSAFDFWRGTVILIFVSLFARLLIAPLALLRWRAAWLSGTAEVL